MLQNERKGSGLMKQKEKKVLYPKIAEELKKRKETQKDLANGINMSEKAISRRLNGIVVWDLEEVKAVCKYFDLSFDDLF